jgi:serine/threonine protein kinase
LRPYTEQQLRAAFPDFDIQWPGREGAFKAAYEAAIDDEFSMLKVLHEPIPVDLDGDNSIEMPERFSREMKAMALVDSPHVVKIERSPQPATIGMRQHIWYVEPLYRGGTLDELISKGPQPELAESLALALLAGVRDMWTQAGIVHRDIKPSNIAFDDYRHPVLLDLGIAFHKDLTALTDAMSPSPRTPRYAAPEQFQARREVVIDFRTDHFQVGIVLYELITGGHPFYEPSADTDAFFSALISGKYDESALNSSSASGELKAVVRRLLAPRPSRRFRDVGEPLRLLGGVVA